MRFLNGIVYVFGIILIIYCVKKIAFESDESKLFRKLARPLELETIPEIKNNWRVYLLKAIQEEPRDEQTYYYFKDVISRPDSDIELYIEGEKIIRWRHHIADYPDIPGVYSAVLARPFHEKNEYGQYGFFAIRFWKSRDSDWKICGYDFEVD